MNYIFINIKMIFINIVMIFCIVEILTTIKNVSLREEHERINTMEKVSYVTVGVTYSF